MTYCYLIHVKIFPARQDGMWYDYPICGPDKCYIASFTTEARVQYVLCVPCEGYGCRGGRPGGGRERERDILLSSYPPLSWVYPCTAQYRRTQLETERSEEQWDPDQRPVAVTQTRGSPDSICCSLSRSPVLGVTQVVTRCDRSSVTSDTEDRLTWM